MGGGSGEREKGEGGRRGSGLERKVSDRDPGGIVFRQ